MDWDCQNGPDKQPGRVLWTCQGCGGKYDADYAYEHKGECEAYRQSLTEPASYDEPDYDDYEGREYEDDDPNWPG